MKQVSNISQYCIVIYPCVAAGMTIAENADDSSLPSEIKPLEFINATNLDSEDFEFALELDSGFLLSREMVENQIIGLNDGEQKIDSDVISTEQSTLGLTLQLAF